MARRPFGSPACDDVAHAPVRCLFDALATIKDPRDCSGRRHALGSLLALLVVSFCTGGQTVKDAVEFGRARRWLRRELGFVHPTCPSQSTYTRLFKVLPLEAVRLALSDWLRSMVEIWAGRRRQGVSASVDGKMLRGAGVHVLNVFVHDLWVLLDQYEVTSRGNEMSAFRTLLDEFLLRYPFVALLSFDAIFCDQQTMDALTRHNRRGLFQVKENQPEGLRRMERWFASVPKDSPDTAGTEKKWGLHRHAQAVHAPLPS